MSEFAFEINITDIERKLKDVDSKLNAIAEKSKQVQTSVNDSFQQMAQGGIDSFLAKLQNVETKLGGLNVNQSKGIVDLGVAAQTSAAQVDKLLAVIAGMAQALSVKKSGGSGKTITEELKEIKPTGIDNVKAALDRMIGSLAKAKSDIQLYKTEIGDSGKSLSSFSFGQTLLKETEQKAKELTASIKALQHAYNSLNNKSEAFGNYIKDLSGTSSVAKQQRADLENLKKVIIERNNLEQKSLALEKERQDAFHKRASAKIDAIYKEVEAEEKKAKALEKSEAKSDAAFHKRSTAKINQIYKEQEAEEKKKKAKLDEEEKRYKDFHKRSTAKINQIYKEQEAEEKKDAAMMASSDKAMKRVLDNIRKEAEERKKVIDAYQPKTGSKFSAVSSVAEWQGLNKQIENAQKKIEQMSVFIKRIEEQKRNLAQGKGGKFTIADSKTADAYKGEIKLLDASIAKWKERQQVIIAANNQIVAQEKFKQQMLAMANGQESFEEQKSKARLAAMKTFYEEQERLAKAAAVKEQERIKQSIALNQQKLKTFSGAMKFSDSAKTEDRQRKAIEFLLEARKKLTTADAEYASKLDDLNGRIERHRFFLKQAAMTTEELAKSRQKYKRELEDKFYSSNATNAISFSQNAKSVNEQIRAIKYLTEARNKLNKNDKDYESTLSQLNNEIRRNKREMDIATEGANRLRGSHNNLMDTADQLKRSLALLFSVSAVTNYVNKLISVRGEFELQQRSLEAILQNKEEANILWNKTVQLAVKSPFRVGELVSYTKQLAAYRIEADKLYETNKMLADISAGLGVDMGRLILAYGQVKAANYLRGTELRQFSEAGVNILGELSKYFTELEGTAVSVGDVFDRVSKRMVSFEDVTHVLKNLTSETGIFYEMQEKQAETLKGMVSNLRDSLDLMLNEIGKSTEGTLKGALSFIKSLVDNWELMATAIKGVVIALAAYKINALLSAEATAKFVYQSKHLTRQITHQVTMTQLASAAWRKFKFSVKGAALSLKSFAASNVWLLGLTAIITTFYELSHANDELNEKLKKINDTRDKEIVQLEKIVSLYKKLDKNKSDNKDYDDIKNIENKKSQLIALQKLAKEKGIEVDLNLKEDTEESLNRQFNALKDKVEYSINFGTDFDSSLTEGLTEVEGWLHVFGDNLQTDMEEFSNSFSQLNGSTRENIKKAMVEVAAMYDTLSDEAKGYYDTIKDGKKETETDDEYLLRQIEYLQKINSLYTRYEDAGYNGAKIRLYDLRHGKEIYNIEKQRLNIVNKRVEFEHELSKVADDILEKYGDISKLDEWQKKTIQLKIDKAFERMELNESAKRVAVFFMNQRFGLPINLIVKPKDAVLEDWQEKVLNSITALNRKLEGKYQIRFGIENVQGKTKEQVQGYIKGMLETAKKAVEIYEKLQGEQKVISDEEYEKYKERLPVLEKMAHVVGLPDEGAKKREQEQVKILKNRISLINEIHKAYKDLSKTMNKDYAKQKVMSSYSETFKKAFEGTEIDLTNFVIDEEKIDKAVGTLTDEVRNKLKELKDKGTYIRSFTEEFIKTLIDNEKKVNKAYLDSGGKVTIGIGNTVDSKGNPIKLGDYWDDEKILKENTILYQKYADALNSVLDKNKDLIITQEQYNALLDVTWQAGKGGVKDIIAYARDVEKFKDWLEEIKNLNVTNGLYGKKRKVKRINNIDVDEEIEKYKKLTNIYEKMAFVAQYVGIRIAGTNDTTDGMLKRGRKRSEQFSTGLVLAEELQKVLTSISAIDFTSEEGLIDVFKSLVPIAQKEGSEAMLTLEREMSKHGVQVDVEAKIKSDKSLKEQVDDLFSGYQMYVELEGMDFPPDLANDLFNLDAISLDELKDKIEGLKPQFEGQDMLDEWDKIVKKINDIEAKAQEERIKEYIKYIREEQDKRVKLKVEEMKKLKEIQDNKDFKPELKKDLMNNVRKDYSANIQKQQWEDFKKSGMYEQMFGDIEHLGTKALDSLYDNLQKIKNSLTDLPVQDAKEIMGIINKIEDVQIDRNPFAEFRDAMKEVKALEKQGRDEDFLQTEMANSQAKIDMAQDELTAINSIMNAREQGIEVTEDLLGEQGKYNDLLSKSPIELLAQKITLEAIINSNKKMQIGLEKDLKSYAKARKAVENLEDEWGAIFNLTQKGYGAIKDILVAFGVSADSTGLALADMGMSLVDMVAQAVMFSFQLKLMSAQAKILGVEMNAALGPIGWAVMALQGIATIFTSVFAIGDKKKEKKIKQEQRAVEQLERSYEKLEKAMESAFSTDSFKNTAELSERNIKMQIASLQRMIQLEDDKKKTDHDKINDWKNQIEDLKDKLKELKEEQLNALGGFGSDADVKNAAEQFAEAWYDAFKETGVGLTGLEDSFQDFINNVVKKQLLFRGTEAIMRPLLNMINHAVEDTILTKEELDNINQEFNNKTKEQLDQLYQSIVDGLGITPDKGNGELSGLQEGIQGVTEETAQIIEAYLNSIRFFVADTNAKFNEYLKIFIGNESENPIIAQLKIVAANTAAIHDLLDSLTSPHPTLGGRGFKVII